MLQPRLSGCFSEMKGIRMPLTFVVCALLLSNLVTCQELNYDEQIESSRIKREGVPENRDLTVLLVNQKRNDYNSRIGRYHSVKPLIGLLTSTARTFIQDGVTTEFATQILGTTLDNGRIYAQLLTKSSLVLYNKPTNVEDPVIVKPTRVHSVFDGQWNVKQDLGFIDPEKFVLKNTDYLAPSSRMEIVYASKPVQENVKFWSPPSSVDNHSENQIFDEPVARRVQPVKEIPKYVQNEAFNFLDGPSIETDKKFEFMVEPSIVENFHTLYRQSKAYEPVTEPINVESRPIDDVIDESNIVKVKPNYDLPTFTIKNEFSPIFYYIDNVESRRPQPQVTQQTKTPKKLFGQKSEPRPKKTFTYAGFADFTTVVGDTVIIFTPNTDTTQPPNPDEVNVYPSAKRVDKLATKITFLAADIPVPTSTFKAYETPSETKITTPSSSSSEETRSEKALFNDEESLEKVLYEVDDKVPDLISVQYNNGFDYNVDVIQPSESPITTTESTRTTEDLEVIPIQEYSPQATEPLSILTPSSTIPETSQESVVTESDIAEIFTNSEEESENTAAEVTEKPEEEEDEDEDEETTTEMVEEVMTTTESGHSEESSEEFETTTESRYIPPEPESMEDNNEETHEETHVETHEESHQEVICTDGLETQSTMTTAYKTLTYLTTYFIPLESTETTTSIKSDVVVESNIGYLTNIVCRTQLDIEPTTVVNVDVNYSVATKVHTPVPVTEESITKPPAEPEIVTEEPKTTAMQEDVQTTVQEEQTVGTTVAEDSEKETETTLEEKEPTTTTTTTTTTEPITTNQGHVDVSVSTEHSTTTSEKPIITEEEVQDQENEIDVIYKTLYTTYTYFTTFFGDQTSSVASHKSVVTDIITSTIDLAKLDPSLLGAFNEDDIAPTSVEVGRPTETLAINSIIDLVKNKDVIESVEVDETYSSQTPTPSLGDDVVASIKPDGVKTYYTTYTFFTTIYVGTDANVCSRSEVYTNYVGPDELVPTKSNPLTAESTKAQFDFRNCKQVKMEQPTNQEENASMETSISVEHDNRHTFEDPQKESALKPTPIEVDMLFSVESNPLDESNYVTDVKSSSSKGERKFLDSNNIILDDQISSESNIEEILPSPTLLLQTSYTTFTYFTTMYIGKDSSKVKSRLETITNVVTETIMPNKEPEEESNLPITYYTTFTYWTTLYKDKSTTITSREEIVSNVVTPAPQSLATASPIDTTPIEVDSVLPPKELEVELKPSAVSDNLEPDDGKATFYTTYTYFTTFYTGNTSQIRSSLETVTNIVDNTKLVEDNQLGRKVAVGPADQNLIQDTGNKPFIAPTVVKEEIIPTKLPDAASASSTVLLGTYIDNLFAEVKPEEKPAGEIQDDSDKKILFSQVAVISGDSKVVTGDSGQTLTETSTTSTTSPTTSTEGSIISPTPEVIESSVAEPEPTTETIQESEEEEEDETLNTRKKSRLTFTPKKPSTTPVIIPFASRNRPTFIPKRVPLASSATTITRADFTPPVITATPSLKSVRPSSGYGGNRKQSAFPGSSASAGKRFPGRSSIANLSGNVPSASRPGGFAQRGSIQPTSRRSGFRSSSLRSNSLDYISRSAVPRVRPTASSRLPPGRNIKPSASVTFAPSDQNDAETLGTLQDETATEPLEEITESPVRTTNNPLLRFRRPPIVRQPGTAITPRSTTPSGRRGITPRGRVTTTTRRSTTRSTSNPLLSLRRQRPNTLFPRRNLLKQPEPEPEEEFKEEEKYEDSGEEILEEEEFEEDNDYDSSDRKERQVASPPASSTKRNAVQIRPFAFRRRTKRQADFSNRKYSNFRRPGVKGTTRRPEPETEPPPPPPPSTQKARPGGRFSSRGSSTKTTTVAAPKQSKTSTPSKSSQSSKSSPSNKSPPSKPSSSGKSSSRQPFIVRGESRSTTTTSAPAYKRGKASRPSSRTTTSVSRPKAPRLHGKGTTTTTRGSTSRTSSGRSRTRTTTSRASSRQRSSFENISGERFNVNNILNDGKITITHHIPTEVTVPVVNGKITEYKNLLSATPSIETLLLNQVSTSLGPLGSPQLVLAAESTELADNGATKIIKYLLHETPTTTIIFTPTTIRGRKTSFSHVLPSTVYNVEAVTQTVAPEINSNVPLANLLLSQLLLGNQQPAINPLLALQGQGLLPQQPIVQTPVTEYKTRTTTYVTTVTDARETVLPITFRGIAILTTIVDPTTNVITATEFVTDTIVTTPTAFGPAPQLNSLLLPLLLQQQQQQPALTLPTANPLLGLAFNTNAIVYDNTPWRPGRDIDLPEKPAEEDERKLKNLATRIMSNGVEVLVKDKNSDGKQEQTKYMEVKTIQPSASTNSYMSNYPKIDKRIDSEEDNSFDLIQPSEVSNTPCTISCSCSNTKTEGLKTKYTNIDLSASSTKYGIKPTKYGATQYLRPTNKESRPYEYETNSPLAPTDKLVEKYTEVINDYSDEKDSASVEESELLTNEQAPTPMKTNKISTKNPEKTKPDKPQKPNKNKFVVADLLKLGTLGIKGLSQLAPVIEKMTGGFIKRQDIVNKTSSSTIKPAAKLTPYNVNKRLDSELEAKHSSFPIYIPVDEMETSESQLVFTNATLHQNLAWAAEHKQPKAHIVPPKIIHESPLVNGGIPISPGEIITANSDVIVGKPAVGGPFTLAASGIKLQNPVIPPSIDSFVSGNEQYLVNEKPLSDQPYDQGIKVDDSFDLRPPEPPKIKPKPTRPIPRPAPSFNMQNIPNDQYPYRMPSSTHDHIMKTEQIKTSGTILGNHGRPAFLDYIPSLARPASSQIQHYIDFTPVNAGSKDIEIADNSPSSSEVVNTKIRTEADYTITGNTELNKPFLVDIQPSRVANVLIPHGSSTALVFAGSSEPHKTGDYVDDPLPYPEPGYFGSFSIDAPQMTNVHNVAPNNNKQFMAKPKFPSTLDSYKPNAPSYKDQSVRNDLKFKWKDSNRPIDYNKIPPPTSNQETHVQVGPQITVYDPEVYRPTNSDFDTPNQSKGKEKPKDVKEIIDKEYENYLAVPPPPPSQKIHYNQDIYDKSKPYSQRPIVHTKPVQDMKVFLNIQHPVPEQLPPKVTSEIYFAAQMPNSKPTPTYTIHIPPVSPAYNHNQGVKNIQPPKTIYNGVTMQNSLSVLSSPNMANKSIISDEHNEKGNTYTVTLNTATNVANDGDIGQVIGSSIAVPVDTLSSGGQLNTDIPIGTNFAIRVEDNSAPLETYNIQGNKKTSIVYDEHNRIPQIALAIGDNRWNKSSTDKNETTVIGNHYYNQNYGNRIVNEPINPSVPPSLNSHANFPMINDYTTPAAVNEAVKSVPEYVDDIILPSTKRPAKLIPNIPTNSHGWYSSIVNENHINNINVEATTRKVIPLIPYEKDSMPQFGQKIASVGKPPTEFWAQKAPSLTNFNLGKPFTKPQSTEKPYTTVSQYTKKPYINYIPSNFGGIKQPAYDIPIRDNSDETTTTNIRLTTQKVKPVYENSEEIYDGEEEIESPGDIDGEVSSESMKVPVVSSSGEIESSSKYSTELTLLQEEVFEPPEDNHEDKNKQPIDFHRGTQTEKPFGKYNHTVFSSNTIKPMNENNPYMKPRPFTVNTEIILDHQLQQPHWQINQMMENSSNISYEDNLDLNIGEEIKTPSTVKPTSTLRPYTTQHDIRYNKPPRPVFANRFNNTQIHNDSIITSIVHIQDKKPLLVEKATEKATLPTFTLSNLEINRTSSEIIDLSPPPPVLDYNFKPSTNDEMIMGMSPPPPRTPSGIRLPTRVPLTPRPVLPIRTPPPYRTKPPRPSPPRVTTQRPVRKPITRDEVSTYRPSYDILNSIRRPAFNRDQPSSQLLPPPRDIPSRIVNPVNELPPPTASVHKVPNVVFPTPVSSGWLTSSGIEFSSSFNFGPTSIQFPETPKPSRIPSTEEISSSENSYSYEVEASSERIDEVSTEKPNTEDKVIVSKESSIESETTTKTTSIEANESVSESSQEEVTTDKMKVVPIFNKNRTRKPYPVRNDEKKPTTNKYKLPSRSTSIIRPTRTLSRPEILYPTRHTSIKKIARPISKPTVVAPLSVIESSESTVEEEFIRPTEVLQENVPSISTTSQIEVSSVVEKDPFVTIAPSLDEPPVVEIIPTHHAGNEVRISDEIIPTKTEFRTTVVTLTKTLSEPPKTVSSIGYVNLTHTLTVTHTKTSLVSQSEGAVTQTLVLTNTHTSTIVDVVTEIYTEVQPTTIIETVTKHIPLPQVQPTPVQEIVPKTKEPLDDISMSSEENENFIIKDETTDNIIQKIDTENEGDNDTFFVVMNKSQNGGQAPTVNTDIETGDYDGVTRNEQLNNNGVSQVLFGEILLAGAPFLETANVNPNGVAYGKECQPDCKASRNERCQRIDGMMKCVCRPGFARMFPDRPCKPTYTYSVKLALGSQGNDRLEFHENLSDNSSKNYQALAVATHEGINRMVMQSDLRDVFHGVHITGFHPVEMKGPGGDLYQGVMNEFYVQLSDNAHENRLKEVIEKYLRNNNYSLGGTEVHAASELMDKLNVSDFDECLSGQFHDCSEHAQCFNLRGTYTCSCLEGFADLSVNTLYPGRICSAEPVGCERCNYHGACYSRDDRRVLCECFQWYAGGSCQINLKVVLISLVVCGALLSVVLAVCAVLACSKRRPPRPQRSIVTCIQSMPSLHQGAMPKQRADRRALISERGESGDASSVQNASLPYMPAKRPSSSGKKLVMSDPPAHDPPPPPPAPAVMIPRARLNPHHGDSRENIARKRSLELSSEAKLISYLESGATTTNDEMRRKHSLESSYSANKERHTKQGALVSAGFKVSTTVRPDDGNMKEDRDDLSSVNKAELEAELSRFDTLRKSYSQEDLSEWTDAERRLGELTLSEARSVGGTLPASTGRAASSTRLTHQEANTMAERDLGSTFLLPHVHLYKPDLTSDVSEFDSL